MPDGEEKGKSAGSRRKREKKKKDPDAKWSPWAKQWRNLLRLVLPSAKDSAVPITDPEVRKLVAALWKDVSTWVIETEGPAASLNLFRAGDESGSRGFPQRPPCEWGFAPAESLLLTVGGDLVGINVEGIF